MPAQRSSQSATTHVLKPERVIRCIVVKLRRVRQYGGTEHGKTVMFTFEGGTRRAQRSRNSFIDRDRVPEFEGEVAWFEVEEVSGTPWSFWRAVRRVEPPANA